MLQIAICDDEPVIRKTVKSILGKHKRIDEFSISEFDSCEALCGQLMNGVVYDLIILDIEFPGTNGVEAGQFLRNKLKDSITQILYISSKEGYEKSLFDNRPINFLKKPINESKMLDCINQVLNMASGDGRIFSFTANRTVYRVPLRNIRYFENNRRRLVMHAIDKDYTFYQKLDQMEELPGFVRIHKSYLVNSLYIRKLLYDKVELDNNVILAISLPYRKQTREYFLGQADII